MKAIILAGGFGTRLQSIVKDLPKPMADIDGQPFLALMLSYLKQFAVDEVVISVGYLQEKIISYFGNLYLGIKISYAREDSPLGTGGAIINSLNNFNEPVLVLNGDSFLKVDLQKFYEFFTKEKCDIAMVLRPMSDCSRYGVVEMDDKNSVKNFAEKNPHTKNGLINGGIYLINPQIFSNFDLPKSFSFEQDFLVKNLSKLDIKGFVASDYFIDIGIPQDYKKAQTDLPLIIKNKALFLDRDGVINLDHGHVYKKENFEFVEGIFDLCHYAQNKGYLIIIVTNQAGIAKGYYTEEQFLELTEWIEENFSKQGIKITKTFYCPYHKEAVIEKYRQDSFDRKPNPGMLLKAIDEFNIAADKSLMIGDKISDELAAKALRIKFKMFLKDDKLIDIISLIRI